MLAVGFEIWQVKAGTIFDNILVTDNIEEAKAHAKETFEVTKEGEKKMKDEADEKERKEEEEREKKRKEEEKDKKDDDKDDKEEEPEEEEEEEEKEEPAAAKDEL
jgi:calreticulin